MSPWAKASAFYLGLTAIYCWPLLLSPATLFPSDAGDSALVTWGLWWNAQAMPFTDRWWNAPMFVPMKGALALSETFLGFSPVSTPLIRAGAPIVLVYNLLFVASFATAAIAAHGLAFRLTGRHDAAIVAGVVFGFHPYRASQLPHLQLLVTCWMPLGLWMLHRYLDRRRVRDLALFGACWLMNGLTTGYYLFFFAVLVGLWMIWFVKDGRVARNIVLAICLATLPVLPIVAGYAHHQSALGLSRSPEEIELFSADVTALAAVSPHVWLPYHWSGPARAEGELYPGLVALLLAAVGAWVAWRQSPRRGWPLVQTILAALGIVVAGVAVLSMAFGGWEISLAGIQISLNRPQRAFSVAFWLFVLSLCCSRRIWTLWQGRSPAFFYAAAAAVMVIFSFGPTVQAFGYPLADRSPYWLLTQIRGGGSLRVPARFAMLFALCLAAAASLAVARLVPSRRKPVLAALVAAILVESWVPAMYVVPVPEMVALPRVGADVPLLELPVGGVFGETAAVLRSTAHGQPLVNGYSGYLPEHYYVMTEALASGDPSILSAYQRRGPLLVLVRRDDDPGGRYLAMAAGAAGSSSMLRTSLGQLFLLPAIDEPERRQNPRIVPDEIRASVNQDLAALMADNDLTTRWGTPEAQSAGDSISLIFREPVTLSSISMSIGDAVSTYPRELRIGMADAGTEQVVWHGRMAGLAAVGIIEDRRKAPVIIDLPMEPTGRTFTLTLTDGHHESPWWIAEIEVFGRRAAPVAPATVQ